MQRRTAAIATVTLAAAAIGAVAYARFVEPRWLTTTRLRFTWPGAAFRIAFASDLHAHGGDAPFLRRVVDRLDAASADLVLLGGDFIAEIDATDAKLRALEPLGSLAARHGVFAVLGNHDYVGRDRIVRTLRALGITVLENESRRVVPGVALVGLGNDRAHDTDARRAFAGVDDTDNVIVLTHSWQALKAKGVGRFELALVGHTHGGQGCIPDLDICPFAEDDMRPFLSGPYLWPAGGVLFVTRGIGESGVRARFGSRPEVAVLDLLPAP